MFDLTNAELYEILQQGNLNYIILNFMTLNYFKLNIMEGNLPGKCEAAGLRSWYVEILCGMCGGLRWQGVGLCMLC